MKAIVGVRVASLVATTFIATLLLSCQSNEPEKETVLQITNPDLSKNYDSLKVYGINTNGGDTVLIYFWKKGDIFQTEVKYPTNLKQSFTLIVKGFNNNSLTYSSSSKVDGGSATSPKVQSKTIAPTLQKPVSGIFTRVGGSLKLSPTWKIRPGVLVANSDTTTKFSFVASFLWRKGDVIVGKDSTFSIDSVTISDSGSYMLTVRNDAGLDSIVFSVAVKHRLPVVDSISNRVLSQGDSLTLKPAILHSDSLIYRWIKDGTVISKNPFLIISIAQKTQDGTYQLLVKNVSDTSDVGKSNIFTFSITNSPVKWNEIIWGRSIWK